MEKPNILHDGTFDIATGRSRKEISWKNKQMLWSEFIARVSETHRTAETYAEYMTAKKPRQDEIKDVGGFVGSYLTSGRRKSGSVLHRQLITLDLDYAKSGTWDDLQLTYSNAALIYSTHKHCSEKPRLRLIMPLSREVRPDEYQAIARRIAGVLDIELFDPTTFQPERLMYWPSTSKDGEYFFEMQDGPWIDADDILNSYRDWTDSSEWPVSERVDAIVKKGIAKQGDPLEKPGVIGAFCRTYSIEEAIDTYLEDVYEECGVDGRYTFKEGSTAAGLVVYDGKYAFSHHGTDPTSGKLCNAFDLVRIHKFGLKDSDVKEGTPGNKLPSYTAMIEYATKDKRIRAAIVSEKMADALGDFEDVLGEDPDNGVEDETPDDTWKEKLDVDRKGNIYSTIDNILLIFENDKYFKNRIAYDDFEKCEVAIRDLPWRKISHLTRRLIDKDDASIRHYLEKTYGISNIAKTRDAMEVLSNKTIFHPIKDYLNSVKWDGTERVNTLLVDYQGAQDSEYLRAVTRKLLVAAVTRIFQPGAKFDYVLVLVGEQGKKKSSLIAKLGKQWFSDSFSTIEGKESFEQLQGVWIVEIAELAGLANKEVEKIKHFIAKREDRFRVAFGRRTERFPRQCVFVASTNKRNFLRDPTGDRRYWPVLINARKPVKDVFKDLTDEEIDQIWAEAVILYRKGETIYLDEKLEQIATEIQKDHKEEHPWAGLIQMYLDIKIPENWHKMNRYERIAFLQGEGEENDEKTGYRTRVCVMEIWEEALNRRELIDERSATSIRNIMRNIGGWEEANSPLRYNSYGVQRKGFVRTDIPAQIMAETIQKPCEN